MDKPIIYLVIPCYNEEEVLLETHRQLSKKLEYLISKESISTDSKMVFVNDGSKDSTWSIISQLHNQDKKVRGINLSKNSGHQRALLAGLLTVNSEADAVISLDADLQDDIDVIDQFVENFTNGFDIVYGTRSARKTDTFFKKHSAQAFYKLMKWLGVDIVYNHADYRLMSKRAIEALSQYHEVNLFLRGMVPLLGYKTTTVDYERKERFAGESKYPLSKMLAFAFDGITSFSIRPIRFVTVCGILLFICSLILLIYILIGYFLGNTVPGWSSIVVSVWGIGGLQLFAIGIIGEYIGKIYMETKARPRFNISDYL